MSSGLRAIMFAFLISLAVSRGARYIRATFRHPSIHSRRSGAVRSSSREDVDIHPWKTDEMWIAIQSIIHVPSQIRSRALGVPFQFP
ncbi:hypothetical protein B0H12DRAFT_30835 [Mycena haematopus]|nr:hypothetical protein B0H12DRAFT_30835 [Mycena haematopus]